MFYDHMYSGVNLSGQDRLEPGNAHERTGQDYIPDFVKLAEAYSALGLRVKRKEDVIPAIETAIAAKRVCVLDFLCTKEENVFPMVPAGKGLHEMIKGVVLV